MNSCSQPGGKPYPPWLWPNLLGLDAPAVAVAWQWLFADAFRIGLPGVLHLILGLSVWCIYLADRLFDAKRTSDTCCGTDRLVFTKKNFAALGTITALACCANLFLIIRHVPRHLMLTGLITALLLGIYYMIRLKGRSSALPVMPREFLCGMLFALGTVIAPHAFAPTGISYLSFVLPTILFGLLCAANCMLISIWEKEADIASKESSAAIQGSPIIPRIATAITALALFSAALAIIGPWRIYLPVGLSAVALGVMLRFDRYIPPPALRVLADAALLTPLLFVWV